MNFTGLDGNKLSVPGLQITGRLAMFQDEQIQAFRLDSSQSALSLYFIRPQKNYHPWEFLGSLTPELWSDWKLKFHATSGQVRLPTIHLECQTSFSTILMALGMGFALNEVRASFSNLCETPPNPRMFINEICQASFFEFSPQATKAPTQSFTISTQLLEMNFDRPFVFLLADAHTGAILLTGSLVRPI
jgi:serine protease inhibitor